MTWNNLTRILFHGSSSGASKNSFVLKELVCYLKSLVLPSHHWCIGTTFASASSTTMFIITVHKKLLINLRVLDINDIWTKNSPILEILHEISHQNKSFTIWTIQRAIATERIWQREFLVEWSREPTCRIFHTAGCRFESRPQLRSL